MPGRLDEAFDHRAPVANRVGKRQLERLRHHARNNDAAAVDLNGSADDRQVAAKAPLPEAVADDQPLHLQGLAVAGEIRLPGVPGGDVGQRLAASAIVDDFAFRDPCLVEVLPTAPDHHARVRIGVGQRPEQDSVDHGEDGAMGPDPERERDERREREPGVRTRARTP